METTHPFTIALRKLRTERNEVDNNSLPTREEICHILRGIQQRMPSRTSEEAYAQMERAKEMSRRCRRDDLDRPPIAPSRLSQNGMSSSEPPKGGSSTGADRAGAL